MALIKSNREKDASSLGKQALFSLLTGILILLDGYLWEVPMFYGADNTFVYSLGFFYLGSIVLFALGGFLLWFAYKEFHWRPNKLLLFPLLLVALTNAIASLSLAGEITPSFASHPYSFPLSFRFVVALSGFDTMFGVFFLFGVLPTALKNKKILFAFLEVISLIALIAIIYSYVVEADSYRIILNEGFLSGRRIQAFTGNSNRMGFDVMAACLAEMFMLHVYHQRWRYLTLSYFFYSLLFTGSKTAIVVVIIAYLAFLFYRAYYHYKNRKRNTAIASLVAGAFLSVMTILFFAGAFHQDTFLGSLSVIMREKIYGGTWDSLITGRGYIWRECWGLITANPYRAIFGYGRANYSLLIREIFSPDFVKNIRTGQSHNAFVEILGEFGFIGLLAYAFLGGLLIRRYIIEIKRHNPVARLCFGLFIITLLRQFTECPGYFDLRYEAIMMGLICVVPVLAPVEPREERISFGATLKEQGRWLVWILFAISPGFIATGQFAEFLVFPFVLFALLIPAFPFIFPRFGFSKEDGALVLCVSVLTLILINILPFDIHDGAHALYYSMPGILCFFYFLLRQYNPFPAFLKIRKEEDKEPSIGKI